MAFLRCLALVFLIAFGATPSQAQDDGLQQLIEAAQADGMRIIVIDPKAAEEEAPPAPAERDEHPLAGIVGNAVQHAEILMERMSDPDWPQPSTNPTKPMLNGIGAVLGLAIGLLVARQFGLMLAPQFPPNSKADAAPRPARVFRAAAGAGLAALVSMAAPFALYGGGSKTVELIGNIMNVFLVSIFVVTTVAAVMERMAETKPDLISGHQAGAFVNAIRILALGLFFFISGAHTLAFMYPDPDFGDLLRVIYLTFCALLLVGAFYGVRQVCPIVMAATLNSSGNWMVRNAWPLILGYAGCAWAIGIVRILNGDTEAIQIVVAPVVGLVIGAAAYHGSLFFLSKVLVRGRDIQFETAEGAAVESHSRAWTERSAAAVAIMVGSLFAFDRAGVPLIEAGGRLSFVSDMALILLISFVLWTYVSSSIDTRLRAELSSGPDESEGDGEGGVGETRLATLLPLVRSFVFVFLAFIVGLILLYEAGVNITPIFASAGIIGLAIGFGAQSLVKDVISGFFFLLDDAFRKGEYIETNGLKGTVERISIRSMQLRHHNGPLNTIPFGAIQDLTNFSRDWVIMKLKLQVTLDTDVERMRKLVKKLGVELLEDPLVGHKFIEPLKSQGVLQIDTWGMTVRVKFKTTPGEQFVIRRVVYTKLHEMFEREGIKFASRDVKVRVDTFDDDGDEEANLAPTSAPSPTSSPAPTPEATSPETAVSAAQEAKRTAAAGAAAMLADDALEQLNPGGFGDER
ncbi:MAG: mechanosensitive ion channel family protein [Pseudomonadota bacterium]